MARRKKHRTLFLGIIKSFKIITIYKISWESYQDNIKKSKLDLYIKYKGGIINKMQS